MDRDVTVWDGAIPALDFFGRIGQGWLSGSQELGPGGASGSAPLFDTNIGGDPNVARLLSEVRYGWSPETVVEFWGVLLPTALAVALFFLVGVVYCTIRVFQIRSAERQAMIKAARPIVTEDIPRIQLRWRRILDQVQSGDERGWRLAILEADILLNELLDLKGFRGETMADKMKGVDVSQFNSIDFAWEAHKTRNRVAHDGERFPLNEREVRRVIKLYERVFREFKFVE